MGGITAPTPLTKRKKERAKELECERERGGGEVIDNRQTRALSHTH